VLQANLFATTRGLRKIKKDKLVYELYGLTQEEIKVIEGQPKSLFHRKRHKPASLVKTHKAFGVDYNDDRCTPVLFQHGVIKDTQRLRR
jgi:hypothetical protein